jgi:hypothetical protein
LPPGSKRIASQIADLIQNSNAERPEDIAARLTVRVSKVHLPPALLNRLIAEYSSMKFSPKLHERVMTDGTRYNLWYRTTSAAHEFHFSFVDLDYGRDQTAHPIVRWMNRVKREVEGRSQ